MIDPRKCKFEDTYHNDFENSDIYYFQYPTELSEIKFAEHDKVCCCISLTVGSNGGYYMQISPTVQNENGSSDIDWVDLEDGIHYNDGICRKLLEMAGGVQ